MDLHFSLAILTSLFFIISCLSNVSAISHIHNHHDHDDHHNQLGFTVDLIHRDSPKSPFYNPSDSPSDRLKKALLRSRSRLGLAAPNAAQAPLFSNRGEYLMEVSLGTPPSRTLAIADTGSDITWTQCLPCRHCYRQASPLFNPARSRTYSAVGCAEGLCGDVTGFTCSAEGGGRGPCLYEVHYGDRSYTKGVIATETLRLGSASVPGFAFGCGHDNDGTFDARGSGIVGLGNGGGSLVSQLGDSIGHRFSYCLVPLRSSGSSTINFGSTAVVSGGGTVTAPLLRDMDPDIFYYVGVKGISVGNKTIAANYNTIIDSGTTLTIIPKAVYDQIASALVKSIPLKRVSDPTGVLDLCYETTTAEPGRNFPSPPITLGLGGRAALQLSTLNTFVRVSDDVVCFALVGDPRGGLSIIGNLAQMNFLVGYDLQKMTVSFKATDCTRN